MLLRRGTHDPAIREYHAGAAYVVAGQTVLAHQPSGTAAKSESPDTGAGYQAAGGRQTFRSRCGVHVAPQGAPLNGRDFRLAVDLDVAQPGQVEKQNAVLDRTPGNVVATAADRQRQSVIGRNAHGEGNVLGIGADDDGGRVTIDGSVP
jgi:hypothetical protein